MHDLIIVGGGPAGLTAAVYAIRKRLNVLLVSQDLGGKINYTMRLPGSEPHQVIRGADVVEKFWQELDYLDFVRRLEPVTAVRQEDDHFNVVLSSGGSLPARSVIYATGVRVQRLEVPGERRLLGRGVSYSAVSYAHLWVDRTAVVIGDGRRARIALAELAHVARTVHLVTPAADPGAALQEIVQAHEHVFMWPQHQIEQIDGEEFVTGVLLKAADGAVKSLPADGVFIELGLQANTGPVADLVELDEQGQIVVDKHNRTSCPGLFAAGDVTDTSIEQVLVAVGEGAKAALQAYEYLLPRI